MLFAISRYLYTTFSNCPFRWCSSNPGSILAHTLYVVVAGFNSSFFQRAIKVVYAAAVPPLSFSLALRATHRRWCSSLFQNTQHQSNTSYYMLFLPALRATNRSCSLFLSQHPAPRATHRSCCSCCFRNIQPQSNTS